LKSEASPELASSNRMHPAAAGRITGIHNVTATIEVKSKRIIYDAPTRELVMKNKPYELNGLLINALQDIVKIQV
jgi:hypothetical protein